MELRNCAYCGRKYMPNRKTSRYCSDKCRVYANRRSSIAGKVSAEKAPRVPAAITEDYVVAVVQSFKADAAALDAASIKGPISTREMCRRLSAAALSALKEVGL